MRRVAGRLSLETGAGEKVDFEVEPGNRLTLKSSKKQLPKTGTGGPWLSEV
jgi:hypothetical protein